MVRMHTASCTRKVTDFITKLGGSRRRVADET
jgi:hypothetical protein